MLVKMYRVPPARAWWPAVDGQLERGLGARLRVSGAGTCIELGFQNLSREVGFMSQVVCKDIQVLVRRSWIQHDVV